MEMIRSDKTSQYERYEEALLRRDNLNKEAEHCHLRYIMEFGDLITRSFEQKMECIRKKKQITYCQKQVNMGRKISAAGMDLYIEQVMAEYQEQLQNIVEDVKTAKAGKRVSTAEVLKVKKKYYRLVKALHPDTHPELAGDEKLKEYWDRIVTAYTYNRLEELEELEVLVNSHLEKNGLQDTRAEIKDAEEKIAAIEQEIQIIITTNPYLYKTILDDKNEMRRRRQQYLDEIASYEMYSAQLDEVLGAFEIERKLS